jgi:hypothetical protein
MARAKAAAAKANEGVTEVEPEAQPVKAGKKAKAAPKPKADPKAKAAPKPVEELTAAVAAPLQPAAPAKPKRAKKAAVAAEPLETIEPIALLQGTPLEVDNVIHISVKHVEIGQRSVYLDSKTQKVYDLKCKYIGRYDIEKECITSFPDSDED